MDHFSICNQNQSISNLVIFHQNTKAIALLFGQNSLIWITFQSAININQFQFRSFVAPLRANYQGYSLTFSPKLADLDHISICNQNQSISNLFIFHQNTKAIALLFGQKSLILIIFQSAININRFQFRSFVAQLWAKYQGYSLTSSPNLADLDHISICNQNQSISNLVIFHQNTKAIALLFGQNSLIWITFQSAIKINQFQIWSFFTIIPRL